jgi:plasmid maintenance system antidote protein VapI
MDPTGRNSSPDDRSDGFKGIQRDPQSEAYAYLLRHLRSELIEAMERSGISRAELARRLGVSPSVITRVMDPTADVLASTLFDFAWAMDHAWQVRLRPKETASLPQANRPVVTVVHGPSASAVSFRDVRSAAA